MRAKILQPVVSRGLVPSWKHHGQCQAIRSTSYLCDKPNTEYRCACTAKYEIQGRKLCTKHASAIALDILCGVKSRFL